MSKTNEIDPEISAITAVHTALKGLEREAQARVLQYVAAKLGIDRSRVDPVGPTAGEKVRR
jgi:hypothetical protein